VEGSEKGLYVIGPRVLASAEFRRDGAKGATGMHRVDDGSGVEKESEPLE
jgi:hypothetical protein